MTQETRRDLRFPLFCTAVIAGAVLLFLYIWNTHATELTAATVPAFALVAGALCVSEYLGIALPEGPSASLSYPLCVAAIVLFGPYWAGIAAAVSALPWLLAEEQRGLVRFSVNTAQRVLAVAGTGLLFLWFGGTPLAGAPPRPLLGMILALTVAAVIGILINAVLVATTLALVQEQTFASIWRETFAWALPSQIALGFAGVAMAEVMVVPKIGGWGLVLFVLPLVVARQTYQQSVKLRAAYADTISSLVAALEAKDVYTKGHSVRVAEYTVAIAQAMGFTQDRVRRIEQAALLHDLGKVGVSRRVLAKEAKLTEGEYEEIKRHPVIGAHIVADVPYLADLVPMIEHHHERFDGKGYGGGTAGTAIPIEARILAVADSYDAMTSVRPYRGAMSHEDAMCELRTNCGTQFDPDAVVAFERGYERLRQAVEPDLGGADR
jgi:HD-GYP domain-containing protein (c-di-GMP phosphodiesterase class II)